MKIRVGDMEIIPTFRTMYMWRDIETNIDQNYQTSKSLASIIVRYNGKQCALASIYNSMEQAVLGITSIFTPAEIIDILSQIDNVCIGTERCRDFTPNLIEALNKACK